MIRADVVVIGSGPAGFSVTQSLLTQGVKVTVIPGGEWSEGRFAKTLEGEKSDSPWGHEPLETHRRAAIGGAGDLWGGRSILFDKIDFDARPWVPDSGWPIDYNEYLSFFEPGTKLLGIDHHTHALPHFTTDASVFENADLTVSEGGVELWSKSTEFSGMWKKLAKAHPGLRLLVGAYCTKISADETGHVTGVHCVSAGETFEIHGEAYVVATGALENPRLLLNAGYGKSLPALGRYYMSHLWFTTYEFGGRPLPSSFDLKRVRGTYRRRRWRLSDSAQEENQLLNAIGFAGREPVNRLSMHDSKPHAANIQMIEDRAFDANGHPQKTIGFMKSMLWSHRGIVPVTQHLLASAVGWKKPLLLPSRRYGRWALWFQGEHAPNPSSRVALTNAKDALGNPKIRVDVNFSELDFDTAARFHQLFDALAINEGFTAYSSRSFSPDMFREFITGQFNSNAHQAGTTRMGRDQQRSVVDANGKVHSSDNLYVAGSSVFPTSSHANPTLSIVMLSIRLGQHLARGIRK